MKLRISFFVVLVFALVALSSCKSTTKDGEGSILPSDLVNNPGSSGADNARMAKITFIKEEHDFGIIKDGEKVFWNFRFTNTGNAPLILNRVKADCGCTVPDYPKTPIAPGEEGKIKVTFDTKGRPGRNVKKVTVLSNSERPTNVLTITAIVEK